MKKKDLTVLIEGLRKLSADITEIADLLSGTETQKEKQEAPADPVEEDLLRRKHLRRSTPRRKSAPSLLTSPDPVSGLR